MQNPFKVPPNLSNYELFDYVDWLNKIHLFYVTKNVLKSIVFSIFMMVVVLGGYYTYGFGNMLRSVMYCLLGIQFCSIMYWLDGMVRRMYARKELKKRGLL